MWDGASWTQAQPTASPVQPNFQVLAFDTAQGVIVGVGGSGAETYTWDGTTWLHITSAGPSPRNSPAGAYDDKISGVVFFGGDSNASMVYADAYFWQGSSWSALPAAAASPSPRYYGAVAYDERHGEAILFGGATKSATFGDTWQWRDGSWTQANIVAARPAARFAASMAYDEARGVVILFGGCVEPGCTRSNDTWSWNGASWSQLAPAHRPPPQGEVGFAYDRKRQVIWMFGANNETWKWDGTDWTMAAPATTQFGFTYDGGPLAYDVARDRIVTAGGDNTGLGTWEWDGTAWANRAETEAPSWRVDHELIYDPVRQRVVMYGGVDNQSMNDAWEWDGTAWTRLQLAVEGLPREAPSFWYDSRARRAIAFGGYGFVDLQNDTAALGYQSLTDVDETCLIATDDDDGDGLAGCADPDCWARCSPLCPPNASCPADAPRCGDGTCDPVEDRLICPSDCP